MKTYNIPEQNLDGLKAKIEKLNKRCKKIGVAEIVLTVGNPVDVEQNHRVLRNFPVTITGSAPIINGYKFIAVLDHVPDVGTIIRALPGEQIGIGYRDAKPNCDHCQENRRRKDTYLVRNEETGDIKQVGSSCLKDFLGHASPEQMAAYAEELAKMGSACEEFERAPLDFSNRYRIPLLHYLGFVAQETLSSGFVSRKDAREKETQSTSDRALSAMYSDQPEALSPEALELAKGALEWAESLQERPADDLNDYEYNLMVVFKSAAIEARSCGLAASAVSGYNRVLERQRWDAEKAARRQRPDNSASQHFGVIGKREVFTLTVEHLRLIESAWGMTHLYTMRDASGNIAKWFSSTDQQFEIGKTYKIKGTVTKHDEYQGTAQTVINRCKVEKE